MKGLALCWLSSIIMAYAMLFLIGDLIFMNWEKAFIELAIALLSMWFLTIQMKKSQIFDI